MVIRHSSDSDFRSHQVSVVNQESFFIEIITFCLVPSQKQGPDPTTYSIR